MIWTVEAKTEAARLWGIGHTGTEIAGKLGYEPKEVYGLARRNKDLFKPRGYGNPCPAQAGGPKKPNPVKPRFPNKAPGYEGVPHGRIGRCQCEFPLWGDHESFDVETSLFCGAPRPADATPPYCNFHYAEARGNGTPAERRALKDAETVIRRHETSH